MEELDRLQQAMQLLHWKRPESVPFPSVQTRYVGRRPLEGASGDSPPTYVIQEVPDDRQEEAMRLMADVFLREEPLTAAFGVRDDPEALEEIHLMWQVLLSQRASVCAVLERPDGSAGPLVAVNILMVSTPGPNPTPQSERLRRVVSVVRKFEALVKPDVFERFGVPEYLTSVGLVVAQEHRGQALAEQLLRARWPLGRALGLRATSTMFTATASQLLARRAGFHTLAEARYADQEDPAVRAITGATGMKIMAAALE
ncbi:uncharacterized protein LOC124777940 [Schistocerca piceifrons]|uniref:uncharacterized protein LOC124777940 n=1 Tax=Schistocerca piceifrons TaxID=274613 RepID=UPI001F5EB357|nr:uncharacterized protein LOC124777940 [Schistocerca piceifrons]